MLAPMVDVRFSSMVIDRAEPRELAAFWSALAGAPIRHAVRRPGLLEPMAAMSSSVIS